MAAEFTVPQTFTPEEELAHLRYVRIQIARNGEGYEIADKSKRMSAIRDIDAIIQRLEAQVAARSYLPTHNQASFRINP